VGAGALDEATLSPDGKLVAAATRQGSPEPVCCLWEVASGRELRRLPLHDFVCALRFSPDSKQLVTGSDDRQGRLWDIKTGTELRSFTGTKEGIWCLAFSPDGKLLVIGERSALRIWETETGKLLRQLGSGPSSLAFTPNGSFVVTGENGGISFWESATGKGRFRLQEPRMGGVFDLAFAPDGRTLATATWDGQVRLWEMATGRIRCIFNGHGDRVFRVAFAPDGRAVASGGVERSVFIWDCTGQTITGKLVPTIGDMGALWDVFASENAEHAYQAEWKLVAGGQQTVAFLQQNLKPIPKDFDRRLREAIAGLEDQHAELRHAAMNELDCFGSLAEPLLRKALADPHSAEARARLEYLLEKQQSQFPSGALLRSLRAIEVLEQIGTPQARQLLESIAAGHPQAALTRDANASLDRLAKKNSSQP